MNKVREYTEEQKKYNREWYLRNREKRLRQSHEWKIKNKDKIRKFPSRQSIFIKNESLKRRHGITLEYFNRLLELQNNVCAICGNKFINEKDKCVDHCHHTGRVRQILCFNCNIGIGKFNDSPELIRRALEYIERHLD